MDVETCESRLIEAVNTLYWLPDPDQKFRNGYRCALPEHVRSKDESYGWQPTRNKHIPSPEAISRYQEALEWLCIIPRQVEHDFMYFALLFQDGQKNPIPWQMVRFNSGYKKCTRQWYLMLYKQWLGTISNRI